MDTASIQFIGFGLAAAVLSNLSRNRAWRTSVLLAASLVFLRLLSPDIATLIPLGGFLLLGYLSVLLVQRGHSRRLVLCVIAVILSYAWLKRYTFFPNGSLLSHPYLVLGLSYIFFRVLHLIIEQEGSTEQQTITLWSYMTYTLNFTTFVCGPIQHYDEFSRDQFATQPLPLGWNVIALQLERILKGFVKVNVVAMLLYSAHQDALMDLSHPLPLSAKLFAAFRIAVLYPFFLYCNFSGYIDIVIALARLMRVRLPENFDRPFSATSFLDFWSRWHITLSLWLKTYVYNPLLMTLMRRVSSPALAPYLGVLSFFITFFLIGIWHGRTSEFVIFGVLQGAGVAINKLWQVWLADSIGRKHYRSLSANPAYQTFSRGLTFTWFAFTLFWFWAGWKQLHAIAASLSLTQWVAVWIGIWISSTIVLVGWEWLRNLLLMPSNAEGPLLTSRYARTVYASAFALVAFVLSVLLNHPAPDLVYKAF